MPEKILVYLTHPHVEAWNFSSRHLEALRSAFPEAEIGVCHNSRDFRAGLPEAEIVMVWYFKPSWLAQASQLKLIATPAAGADWIEVTPRKNLKIFFGGFHGLMMAESVVGAVFYFCKAFRLSEEMRKKHKWARIKISQRLTSLYRARVTIWGFGRIGRTIGRVLQPFGCVITGVKRTAVPPPSWFTESGRIIAPDGLPETLKTTDHLILALPGGSETDGIFTREHFRLLPRGCFIYNVGRGNPYAEADLVSALAGGEIAGAYLDVFATEPLPEDSPLWDLENVLIQPHLSAAAPQYLDLFVEEFIQGPGRHL